MGESATRGARGDGDDASLAGVIGGDSSIACVDSGDVELDDGLQVRVTRIEGKVPVSFIKGVDFIYAPVQDARLDGLTIAWPAT